MRDTCATDARPKQLTQSRELGVISRGATDIARWSDSAKGNDSARWNDIAKWCDITEMGKAPIFSERKKS